MKAAALMVFLLAAPTLLLVGASSLNALDAKKNFPVSKVVELLRDMSSQLQKEQEADEEVYEKLACWCETNDKAKTKAIAEAEARISDLTSKIESLTAESARLNLEITNLEKEIATNKEALEVAKALREKQLAEFNEEEKEMLQSIQALGAAVIVLSKHHSGGKAPPAAALAKAVEVVRTQLKKHKALLQGAITPAERALISAFLQEPTDYSGAKPTFKQAYTPQSGQVFGILKEMKATFERNLSEAQKEELENQEAFKELKALKEQEIAAGEASLEQKKQHLASVDEKNAQAQEDLEDTRNSLSADQKFLMMLKEKCSLTDKEWEDRQKMRQEEQVAIAEAIKILSSDEARDTFSKTYNPANFFVQKASSLGLQSRAEIAGIIKKAAEKASDPKLAALATVVRAATSLDAFTRVKKAIDDMVAELLKEKADEIEHKDFCLKDLHENELQTERTLRTKSLLESKIEGLKMTIKGFSTAIETLKSEISDLQTQLKRAGEDRELQHQDFKNIVGDQREAQVLLQKALVKLKSFYMPRTALVAAVIHKQGQNPAPPPGFDEYKKQGQAATPVIMLIEQIIADTKAMEAALMHDEEEAQKAYEGFVQETNRSIKEKQIGITNKAEDRSKAEQDLTQAETELEGTQSTMESLSKSAGALHASCDFVLKNMDARQAARDEEIEALRQAKAVLSGMKLSE